MKLCYISDPNSSHTRRWVGWFARHGHEVCLLADIPQKEPWPEIKVIDLSKTSHARLVRFPVWALWIRRFLLEWQPDILHAHRVNSAGWLAAASSFHPLIITPWGSDVFVQPQRSWLARVLARYTLGRADLVTTNSQAMGEQVVKLGAHEGSVSPVQFGVELEIFNPAQPGSTKDADLRQKLSIPEDAPLVLSPRGIRPIYRIDVILQSIPVVRQAYPGVRYLFIDYNVEPAYKKKLDALVQELGLEENIRWLPPTQSRAEMADLYRLSDLVISVPSSDATPISVLEAMACGKAVICSDLPPLHELIRSGENGWLVPAGQAQPLAEAAIHLLALPGLTAELGRNAYQGVAQSYNYELEMQKMESLYRKLAIFPPRNE